MSSYLFSEAYQIEKKVKPCVIISLSYDSYRYNVLNFSSAVLLFSVEQDIHNPLLKKDISGAQGPSTKQSSGAERSVTLQLPSSSISAFVRDTPTYPLLPPSPF